ncbi:MAG: PAS domain S-box protein [Candidatus Thorarchaeota archaeon]
MSDFGDIGLKIEDFEKITQGLRAMCLNSPVAIATANRDGIFIDCNKAMLDLYGLNDLAEFQQLNLFNDPTLVEENKNLLRKNKVVNYSATFDFDFLRREGVLRTARKGIAHYDVFISPFDLAYLGQKGYFLVVIDVTDRKDFEEKLKESEEKYRKLVDTSPDAITVTNLEGNIVTLSKQTLALHGYDKEEELIGQSAMKLIAKESHEKAIVNMERTLKEGSISDEEYIFVRKDGTKFPAELNASLIYDLESKPEYYIAVTRDITARKKAEQKLKESVDKFQMLFNNTNDTIFLFEIDKKGNIGKFVEVNDVMHKWTGYTKDELLEMLPIDLLPQDMLEEAGKTIETIIEKGFLTSEIEILTKDGTRMPVELSSSLIILDDKKYILSSGREIMDRVEARLAKEKEVQEKTLLLDIITHDLRNYLVPLWLCISETEKKDEIKREDLRKTALLAKAALAKTDSLIDNISVLMKRDIDFTYELKAISIIENINKSIDNLKEVFPAKNIVVNTEDVNPTHKVKADALFELMLLNILTNATKNDPKDAVIIDISTKDIVDKKILLTVADHGEGIPLEERDGIFERYGEFRKKGKGSGLGLFIIKTLVERYNGKVWIESTVPGYYKKGTSFKIELQKA